jgi:hypothetical protein
MFFCFFVESGEVRQDFNLRSRFANQFIYLGLMDPALIYPVAWLPIKFSTIVTARAYPPVMRKFTLRFYLNVTVGGPGFVVM